MMRNIILLLLILCGCASAREVVIDVSDSTNHVAHERDSSHVSTRERDSIYQRDSIYIYQKGDTLYKYVGQIIYKWRTRTDTTTKYVEKVDTLYKERERVVTLPTAQPIKWYNQGFIWLGRLCLIALILWAIFLYIKRKF